MRTFRAVARIRRRATHADDGFGMIELMVTVGVVLVAMIAVVYTATVAFTDIAEARQRQAATGLANQTMEQIRGLPFDTLSRGLSNADLAATAGTSDPNITTTGCGSGTVYCYGTEQIPRGDNPTVTPLVPHSQTITVGPATYTVRAYVTYYQNSLTANAYRVTVLVSWTNPARGSLLTTVQVQSLFYSPGGCLSTATHPFAAPCQPFLYTSGSLDQGHIDVTGTISGLTLDNATLWLPGEGSEVQAEQINAVQGASQTSGASLQQTGQNEQYVGRTGLTTAADNDPAGSRPTYLSLTQGAQSAQSLSMSGSGNTITVTDGAGDTGSTTSTVSATTSPSYPCPHINGVLDLNNALPCGGSYAQQAGTSSTTLDLTAGGTDLGVMTLASVGPPSCATSPCNRAIAYRFLVPTSGFCPGTSADGCTHGEATRTIGQVTLAGLPPGLPAPASWSGYLVRLNSWADSVSAEAGIGVAAPAVTAPQGGTGTVTYWNGGGYTTCTVYASGCMSGGSLLNVASVTVNGTAGGSPVVLTITTTLSASGKSTTQTPIGCGGTCTRTQASASSQSPLSGDIHYVITHAGNTIADFTVHVALGTLLANASYQAAPSGS